MNILVLICDQLRFDALECNGNSYVSTPNFNRLAARSVQFASAYTSAPICSPARHSLISGLYPFAHGVLNNEMKPSGPLTTVADQLNALGYRSIHVSAVPEKGNSKYGFESVKPKNLMELLSEEDKKRVEWEHTGPIRRRSAGPSTRPTELHKGYLVAEKAVELIEEAAAKNENFHMWIGFSEPHPPFYPSRPFFEKFDQSQFKLPGEMPETAPAPHSYVTKQQQEWSHMTDDQKRQMFAGYYGLVEMADQFVGKVLDTVERLNLLEDTLIVFTADHGEQLGDHGLYLKFVMREQSVHVPLMFSHPSFTPAIRSELVAHVDLFSTLCDMAGAEIPGHLHGRSLRPLLEGEPTPSDWRKEVISQMETRLMLRTAEWKLNVYDGGPGELYQLTEDPQEFNNLIHNPEYSDIIHRLMKELEAKMASETV
jgi:arylsulfatase A-like enzyme